MVGVRTQKISAHNAPAPIAAKTPARQTVTRWKPGQSQSGIVIVELVYYFEPGPVDPHRMADALERPTGFACHDDRGSALFILELAEPMFQQQERS